MHIFWWGCSSQNTIWGFFIPLLTLILIWLELFFNKHINVIKIVHWYALIPQKMFLTVAYGVFLITLMQFFKDNSSYICIIYYYIEFYIYIYIYILLYWVIYIYIYIYIYLYICLYVCIKLVRSESHHTECSNLTEVRWA